MTMSPLTIEGAVAPAKPIETAEQEEPVRSSVEIVAHDDRWAAVEGLEDLLARAVAVALSRAGQSGAVSIALSNDDEIRKLNRTWRGADKPTNVLSFPQPGTMSHAEGEERALGDVILAFETVSREAEAEGKPLRHHAAHLAVHGTLHLLGHDHEDDAAAEEMESLEADILAALGIPNPYETGSACEGSPDETGPQAY